jgi:ABC-type branched-subunit amino acid transport system substrate-binding protein
LSSQSANCSTSPRISQKRYDTGASDAEIKVGNIMPYSGPASSYGVIGKTEAAFFQMINDQGGINGRRINFISYDDSYSPPPVCFRNAGQPSAIRSLCQSVQRGSTIQDELD